MKTLETTLLICLFCIGFILGVRFCATTPVKQKAPIKPDIQIIIKNGVSDTTYIYKFK